MAMWSALQRLWETWVARRLQYRIALLFTLLLVAIQAAGLLFMTTANDRIARTAIDDALTQGERVFKRVLQQNQSRLEQGVAILSGDFAFRTAIASNERGTIDSVLRNHGARVKADAMMLIGLDRVVRADTLTPAHVDRAFGFAALIEEAEHDGKASTIAILGSQLFQLVVVPVLAPEPIAWVAMGFRIDDASANELKQLAGLEVSFATLGPDREWRVHASTLDDTQRRELVAPHQSRPPADEWVLAGMRYETRAVMLPGQRGTQTLVLLQRPLDAALAPFRQIERAVLWLTLLGAVLAALGSALIARRIVRPIDRLALLAQRIEGGDYAEPIVVQRRDEIGALAGSFDRMRDGIATRETRILKLAYEDGLTGLPNRALFLRRLEQAIAAADHPAGPPSILLLDLDRFKAINDTLGHVVGDRVLMMVGERLRAALREPAYLARLGGDEFAVLLTPGGEVQATAAARTILAVLEAPISIDAQSMDVGASIGIAHYPAHGDNAGALMRAADVAMYAAKRDKSGYVAFDARAHDQHRSHLTLLGELRRAVEADELVLHYQPKWSLDADRATCVEALLRWQHPERGCLPPGEFIPFAELTGYIGTLTRWVVRTALRQCGQWHAEGRSLQLSFNVSASDLREREDLPGQVAGAMHQYGVPPALVCIEITESALMQDPITSQTTLRRLHDMGVSLSIDDYGTGYSSLAYLKQLAVNELKIDHTFVMGMEADRKNLAIIRSTIELGHNLGLAVTAEGVETDEEWRQLARMGCDVVQGFRIGRPMEAAQLAAWLAMPQAAPRDTAR